MFELELPELPHPAMASSPKPAELASAAADTERELGWWAKILKKRPNLGLKKMVRLGGAHPKRRRAVASPKPMEADMGAAGDSGDGEDAKKAAAAAAKPAKALDAADDEDDDVVVTKELKRGADRPLTWSFIWGQACAMKAQRKGKQAQKYLAAKGEAMRRQQKGKGGGKKQRHQGKGKGWWNMSFKDDGMGKRRKQDIYDQNKYGISMGKHEKPPEPAHPPPPKPAKMDPMPPQKLDPLPPPKVEPPKVEPLPPPKVAPLPPPPPPKIPPPPPPSSGAQFPPVPPALPIPAGCVGDGRGGYYLPGQAGYVDRDGNFHPHLGRVQNHSCHVRSD